MSDADGEWYGWRGDDLTIEVALDARGAAAELSRLRAEVERLSDRLDPINRDAGQCGGCRDLGEQGVLRAIDLFDLERGIVRVDTTGEALVERLGEVIFRTDVAMTGVYMSPDDARVHARAVLAALREAAR